MILRQIKCDVTGCTTSAVETAPNAGFPGWGALHGIEMNGQPNPNLCPECLTRAANYIDTLHLEAI